MSQFPDVPLLPGVPPLLRSPNFPATAAVIATNVLANTAINYIFKKPNKVWGVFDQDGNAICSFDTFVGMTYKSDYKVSSFPVEKGSFASYNKVRTPAVITARFAQGGDNAAQLQFAAGFQAGQENTTLYNIITPTIPYSSRTIQSIDFRREASNGANMLIFDVTFIQVIEVTAQYVKPPANISGAKPSSTGLVQAVKPSAQVQSVLSSAIDAIKGLFQ